MSRPDPDPDPLLGTTVWDKYRVDRLIGRGGMGAVYQATNTGIEKRVALKFLDRDAARDLDAVARFQREAQAASAVESAHIVQIFDAGRSEADRPFLVMELLTGEDLRARLRREKRLGVAEVVHIAGQVLRALDRAHEAGIVHRDLKPDNVFLCQRDDDPMFVKIVDFGISKVARKTSNADTLTRRGTVLGTAYYMSPEQAQAFRDIDGRTDLFSLGSIMFEALAGRPPHVGTAYEAILIDICTKDSPDVRQFAPEVTEPLARVIARALQRDRDQRFQSAGEFYEALAAAAPGLVRTGGPSGSRDALLSGDVSSSQRPLRSDPGGEGRVVTVEGTAVRSRADARTQTRRTVVVGLVAALGAFAVTVLLMARHRGADPAALTPVQASAAAAPGASAELAASAPAPAPSGSSASADAGADAASRLPAPPATHRTAAHVHAVPHVTHAKPTATAPPEHAGGVASGLQLNTQGP
jgi:serine/threonine protein kinase